MHLRGVKHMQNALEKAQKKDPDKFKEERVAEIEAVKKEVTNSVLKIDLFESKICPFLLGLTYA